MKTRMRLAVRLGLMGLALILCVSFGVALSVAPAAEQYPGSIQVADDTLRFYQPNYVNRRTSVYRTNDAFNKVYNWYSSGFNLGPEAHAQGNCILIAHSTTALLILEEQMSVTLCNTPNGTMAFVMHTRSVRYTAWLRGLGR